MEGSLASFAFAMCVSVWFKGSVQNVLCFHIMLLLFGGADGLRCRGRKEMFGGGVKLTLFCCYFCFFLSLSRNMLWRHNWFIRAQY